MTAPRSIEGRCLCGAVTARATVSAARVRACHCDMCRQHTSGAFVSLETDTLAFDGPVTTYQSSDWAERGFCAICGSTLFYGTTEDGARHVAAGLFENAGGGTLKIEFFADQCPQGYRLEGDHRRLSTAETEAMFAPTEGDNT